MRICPSAAPPKPARHTQFTEGCFHEGMSAFETAFVAFVVFFVVASVHAVATKHAS